MIYLLYQGHYEIFVLLIIAIVMSLSFHEFGHAYVAKLQGDTTAQRAGRMTLNPMAHIDPFGLLMVVMVGFGYARPVPTDPRNFKSFFGNFWVAGAGPFMNLVLAFISVNLLAFYYPIPESAGGALFLALLAQINLLLMLFNLIPIGPLDGHYMLPYLLPRELARRYVYLNERHGTILLLALIVLSVLGVPIFRYLIDFSAFLIQYLVVV